MFAGEICFLERFLIMKKFTILLIAALTLFVACGEKIPLGTVANYSISGEVSDADGDMQRLTASSIVVGLTDSKGQLVALGELRPTEEDRRFCFPGIPAGKYSLELYSEFYEDLSCPVTVEKDVVQDITLTPVRAFTVDQTSLDFPPRVTARTLTITNTSDKELRVSLKPRGNVTSILDIKNALRDSDWFVLLAAGETKQVTIEVHHGDIGEEKGFLDISALTGNHRTFNRIPMSIVTDERDFGPTVFGRVTDKQGKPLQGILLECEGRTMLSDEDGRYVFEGPFENSMVKVAAYAEFYNYQISDPIECKPADIEVNFALEPCSNHLTLDRTEVDFGTGSISGATGPETIQITLTAEKDGIISFHVGSINTVAYNRGIISTSSGAMEKTCVLDFTLYRENGDVGPCQYTAMLTTDTAGTYFIPVSFVNVP